VRALETDTERWVAKCWRSVLGISDVGRDGDFFALGGNSLRAIRVLARVEERCGLRLGLRLLFDNPILCDFAAAIDDAVLGAG
jgi:hypothetical protein